MPQLLDNLPTLHICFRTHNAYSEFHYANLTKETTGDQSVLEELYGFESERTIRVCMDSKLS